MTSPNGTVVTANTGGAITDSKGNVWTISASGLVVENGVADAFTANVTELAFKNGVLWQENTSFLWYAKVGNVPGSYHGWSPGTYIAPVPVARTWVGGGSNSAGNPNDWNDHGAPQAGDSLTMSSGTMNVTGLQLQGDSVSVPLGDTVTVNVSGVTDLSLSVGGFGPGSHATVNLAANSEWIGGFGVGPTGGASLVVQGTGAFDNTSSEIQGSALIKSNVIGTGSFLADRAHGPGAIEFAHSVSAGQTVNIVSGGYIQGEGGTVQVDDPTHYSATTNLSLGTLILEGIKASSYTFQGSDLLLFNGKSLVGAWTVENNPNGPGASAPISVSQVGSAIDINKGSGIVGVVLPVHV
jgi:hypothetical protein